MNTLSNPIAITKVNHATHYHVSLCRFILHSSVDIVIMLYDDQNVVVKEVTRVLEGEEYSNWGFDDNYIENIVNEELQKLQTA